MTYRLLREELIRLQLGRGPDFCSCRHCVTKIVCLYWRQWDCLASRLGSRALAAAFPFVLLTGCSGGVLDPQGPVGGAETKILLNSLGIMLVIVVPTILATLFFAWWFRESNARASYLPEFVYSGRIELVVWSIPILVILFLGGIIWIGSHDLDPFRPLPSQRKPTEVQVVSLDWKWLFIYPEQNIASVNQLVIPAGAPAHFSMTSASVMNQFFILQLGGMMATMNGMVTQLNLQADRPGEYYGRSNQFSGDGFPDMQFTVHAVPEPEFAAWVDAARGTGAVLDQSGYLALLKQSRNVPVFTYRGVEPNLFGKIATQQLPPGPGPHAAAGIDVDHGSGHGHQ